jgi:hypothetical protein
MPITKAETVRLALRLAAALAAIALMSCAARPVQQASSVSGQSSPAATPIIEHETAVLAGAVLADSRLAALMPGRLAAGSAGQRSASSSAAKKAATIQDSWVNGQASDSASANTSDAGTAKALTGTGGSSWAVYRLIGIGALDTIKRVLVETSNSTFSGPLPGYWVGIADYSHGRWEVFARVTSALYQRTLSETAPHRKDDGSAYVFVLVTAGQGVHVERVGIELDRQLWREVVLDAGPNAGWTPAIDFSLSDNPLVIYADHASGMPKFAVCDRAQGFGVVANWVFSTIDPQPEGQARWLDVKTDPVDGLPRVSLSYVGVGTGASNSEAGLSLLADVGQGPVWLNYRVQSTIDGAEYTSIDSEPGTGKYGMATQVVNADTPTEPANDMHYRLWDLSDVMAPQISLTRHFGPGWLTPHLRFRPSVANPAACYGAAYLRYRSAPATWDQLFNATDADGMCSLAFNPAVAASALAGLGYSRLHSGAEELCYVQLDSSLVPSPPVVVDSIASGSGRWVGKASQIAFAPDGTPAIAYLHCDGTHLRVKYAWWSGSAWTVEDVSTLTGDLPGAGQTVLVDLAFDAAGVPAVCYNRLSGGSCTLRVALRGQ